jgi:nitroalkane oxidase
VTDSMDFRSAYSKSHPLANLLQDATVLPIFDGGNVGVRRRNIEKIFADPEYDAWEATFGKEEKDKQSNGVH